MAQKVVVGCRLPNGIILEHPSDPKIKVELNGLNKVTIIGAPYAHNDVDADFWDAWFAVNKDFAPLKNGAIFVAKSSEDAQAKAREIKKERTGFEAMAQDAHGVTPAGKAA